MTQINDGLILLIKQFGGDLNSSTPLFEQFDSMKLVEFIVALEKEFKIDVTITDYDPRQFANLDTISALIVSKIGN